MKLRSRTRLAIAWFLLTLAFQISPLFDWLGNHAGPRVFGHPWSIVYVLGIVWLNFLVLAWLYWGRVLVPRPGDQEPGQHD